MNKARKKQLNIVCHSFSELDFKCIPFQGNIRVLLFLNNFSEYADKDMKTLVNMLVLLWCIEISFVWPGSEHFANYESIENLFSIYTNLEQDYEWAIASSVQDSNQKKYKNTSDFIIYDDEKLMKYFLKNHYAWRMITVK